MGSIETFIWGFFGGIGAELAVLFGVRQQFPDRFPYWIRSTAYYILAILMALVGGGIALAYVRSGTALNAILAIQVGASAPLFFRKAREVVAEPPKPPDERRID
jgi:hypothetical protein